MKADRIFIYNVNLHLLKKKNIIIISFLDFIPPPLMKGIDL